MIAKMLRRFAAARQTRDMALHVIGRVGVVKCVK